MKHTRSLALALIAGALAIGGAVAQDAPAGGDLTPIRPPAVPLIVRSPYVSTWQPANTLAGQWAKFWAGQEKAITGLAKIDGQTYLFMGAPNLDGQTLTAMTQTALRITPTQSIYTFRQAGVTLTVDFLSPVEPTDLRRQSIPLGYIFATARSADGKSHTVRLYFDISGQWASGDPNAKITWQRQSVPDAAGPLTVFTATPAEPNLLHESGDSATWGQAVWATHAQNGLTTQAGADTVVRGAFVQSGALDGSVDSDQPRAINDRWPVFAFDFDLGQVGKNETRPITLTLGNVRTPAVSYQEKPVPPLWQSYWPDWQGMTADFTADAPTARAHADKLDAHMTADATKAGGPKYAALCALALRQAFGATELVGTAQKPWMFMKEISSDGNISTVDVIYPSFPVFLYTNPYLVRLQMDPLFDYAESGLWPQKFAPHDIGASYPRADGHNKGGGENMPVEESANMLIMAAAYLRYAPKAEAAAYAKQHYQILKQWADYLLTVPEGGTSPNALDPEYQNQTDDFTGSIAHSVNLALKGILGVGAMGQIADYAGNATDKTHYADAAKTMIGQWARMGQSQTGPHMMMQYIEADTPQPKSAGWTAGIVGPHALALHGANSADVSQPVVDTTQSYTVAAWVRPETVKGYQTYVGIDGKHVSGFFLQLTGAGKFALSALENDSEKPGATTSALSNDAPTAGTWYHLAGVYDAAAHTLALYVNGVLQQTVPYASAFHAGGATAVGRGFYGGHGADFVSGDMDDVRFYQAALSPTDVLAVAQDGGASLPTAGTPPASNAHAVAQTPAAYWTFDEGAGATLPDASGNGHVAALKMEGFDPNTAWSLKYNAFPDKVLGLNLIPQNVLKEEARFYMTQRNEFGIPLDIRHTYTKGDWELWTAASTDDAKLRQAFIDGVYKFANTSDARVPFGDWYDTVSGQKNGFQARPVIGGLFAVLDRTALKPNK
ncbi:MAG: DUF5127 domain-containing protein [Armatimonadota bacterium]|nr:DUF5127 domain-containing protein [Armatimonadota bacterium]